MVDSSLFVHHSIFKKAKARIHYGFGLLISVGESPVELQGIEHNLSYCLIAN